MPHTQGTAQCVVRLVALRGLSPETLAQCGALRQEAGRLWTTLVHLHAQARAQGTWLSAADLEQASTEGHYALHSQSVRALCQKFAANVAAATDLRSQEGAHGAVMTRYPRHATAHQTVVWKDQALKVLPTGHLRLPTGGQRLPLLLPLPAEYQDATLRRAELTWRSDHYELCLTLDASEAPSPALPGEEVAGIDLGEAHLAAVCTTRRHALVVSGRKLRSCTRGHHKRHEAIQEKLSRCQSGSRRANRLRKRQAQVSAKLSRQQREILHQTARKVVDFCHTEGVTRIAMGDVRDIQREVSQETKTSQELSQWPYEQLARYLREKAAPLEISVEWLDERYSTKTCSYCQHQHATSPRGRRFRCAGCGARMHRDVNGSNNICSKRAYGSYGRVQADQVNYLRPIGVAPRHRP
ncbi:MAG TPA: transposase [Ktedonobacterales bacterium]